MKPMFRYALELCVCFVFVHFIQFTEWQSVYPRLNQLSQSSRISDVSHSIEPVVAVNDEIAKELKDQVRILCWVLTTPKYHWFKARHVKNTWGKRCNVLLFMSSEEDSRIPTIKLNVTEGYKYLWEKTREAFKYVWENYQNQADWFLKADDDSYVVLENLRYLLTAYNTSKPLYFGHKFKTHLKKGFMHGGPGYVLSREAVRRFVDIGLKDGKHCSKKTDGHEDVEIGRCLTYLGCDGVDTRDAYARERFLPWSLKKHAGIGFTGTFTLGDLRYTFYPIQKGYSCCSDTAIGFHKVSASDMYVYDYLIYTMNPYGFNDKRSEIQMNPDPSPDADLSAKPYHPSAEEKKWVADFLEMEELEKNKFKRQPKNKTIQSIDDFQTPKVNANEKK